MGLPHEIAVSYRKSEAAVVVQNLLELQASVGTFHSDPAKAATALVEAIWSLKPVYFDVGKGSVNAHTRSPLPLPRLRFGRPPGSKTHANRNGFLLALCAITSRS